MTSLLLLAIFVFVVCMYLFWLTTHKHFIKMYGETYFKQTTSKLYYWQGAIFFGIGGALLVVYVVKYFNWMN
ncbi:hypothetical protein [Nonlabens sp. MIC269]|uniref:hypothetical protein n=1 Tax=Nonlabens sp. MIC269 TaxID=1476901 RepID=UPI000A80885D|nr:hypothetical protein [Nonlabens sp. MIC269]